MIVEERHERIASAQGLGAGSRRSLATFCEVRAATDCSASVRDTSRKRTARDLSRASAEGLLPPIQMGTGSGGRGAMPAGPRVTAAVDLPTLRLVRWRIGDWSVDGLAPGEWRELAV